MEGGGPTFLTDSRGAVAPLFAVALITLAAVGGLAWDVSRGFALRSELDAAVDAAALAGATQLDGKNGAKLRATAAAESGLVTNSERLATVADADVSATGKVAICFKSTLSGACTTTVADASANFIQVDANPKAMGLVFGALARVGRFQVVAHAVAGYGTALCKVPPLMICNPNESADPDFTNVVPGQGISILSVAGGNSTLWHPGNFGFLQVNGSAATGDIADAMARVSPLAQCFGDAVDTATGVKDPIRQALNVRFDLYTPSMKNKEAKDVNYQPAMNTIVGQIASANATCDESTVAAPSAVCPNPATSATGMGLPPDCGQPDQGFGSGTWDYNRYFAINHDVSYITSVTWSNFGPNGPMAPKPTRYQVYNWEKSLLAGAPPANTFISGPGISGRAGTTGTSDFARPMCYSGGTAPSQQSPDRRTISAVLVNCTAAGVSGLSRNVPVIGGIDIFLVRPVVDHGVSAQIYGEVIGRTSDLSAVGKETRLYSVRLYE